MQITYWSDYACPFCYIGEGFLKQAIAKLDTKETFEFVMKAFQLDPGAPLKAEKPNIERTMAKYHMTREQAEARLAQMNAMSAAAGLEFNYATALNTNTMDAHRLTKYAQREEPEKADKLIETLYENYFVRNTELADHEILKAAAAEAGLNMERVEQVLNSDEYLHKVRGEIQEAAEMGIRGVPFFIIGQYGVSGAQPAEFMQEVLETVLKEEMQKKMQTGMACGIDGCDF